MRRHNTPAGRPRQAEAFACQRQAGKTRLPMEVFGGELIQRNGVAEAGPAFGMRSAGQEAVVGIVAGAEVRGRQSGDNRKVAPELLQHIQIRSEFIVFAGLLREEKRRMKAQWRIDADQTPWCFVCGSWCLVFRFWGVGRESA